MPERIYLIVGVICILGLIFTGLAIKKLWEKHLLSGSFHGLLGISFLLLTAVVILMIANLYTYQRFTHEQKIATLNFKALGPQYFQTKIQLPSGHTQVLIIYGDQWQLDARILKWQGFGTLLGLNSLFRLERLSGRYQDSEDEISKPRSIHNLHNTAGLELWEIAKDYQHWLPWIDSYYGNATYMPMADGAIFDVSLTSSGLLARPANDYADDSIQNWQ